MENKIYVVNLIEANKAANFDWKSPVDSLYQEETVELVKNADNIFVPQLVERTCAELYYPEFISARFYSFEQIKHGVVVSGAFNKKWKVRFFPKYKTEYGHPVPDGGKLEFEECAADLPETAYLTKQEAVKDDGFLTNETVNVQLFGQPNFKQHDLVIKMKNADYPLPVFLTYWDGWGDCGTWNVFVEFDGEDNPVNALYESSHS